MATQVQVTLTSGDKYEFKQVLDVALDNDLLIIRGRSGGEEMTRAIFRKELVKSVLQSADNGND